MGTWISNVYLLWSEIFFILLFTALFELFLISLFKKKPIFFPFSALITAMGVVLMMASTSWWMYMVVIALGLIQKQMLQFNEQHFFNPSNFALILGLFLFYDEAHIVLGQLGDAFWLNGLLLVMAFFILVRVNRWIIPLSFAFFYLLLQYLWVVSFDPVMIMEEIYYRFYSVSFILFMVFMLTDPKTTPSKPYQQIIFSLLIALFSVALDHYNGFRVQHLFLALFLFSLFVPFVTQWNKVTPRGWLMSFLLLLIAITVIINIEMKPPYYFTMDG